MMTVRLQIVVAIVMITALAVIIEMIRRKMLELKYALVWLIVGTAVLVMDFFPQSMNWIAEKLGIASPVNMLFFFGFCFLLIIIFVLTIAVSSLSVRVKNLAQEIALNEKDSNSK